MESCFECDKDNFSKMIIDIYFGQHTRHVKKIEFEILSLFTKIANSSFEITQAISDFNGTNLLVQLSSKE